MNVYICSIDGFICGCDQPLFDGKQKVFCENCTDKCKQAFKKVKTTFCKTCDTRLTKGEKQ
jgi:hypothetical protein